MKCSNIILQKYYAFKSRITGNYGFIAKFNTLVLIRKLNKIQPDIVHLHNIHDHTVSLNMLFWYLKK